MLDSLDCAVIAVAALADATERYASLLGRPPSWWGVTPGAGTANSLFRLDNCCVELLARDGDGPGGREVAAAIEARGEGLVALAFGTADADAVAAELRARGIEAADPRDGESRHRGTPRALRSGAGREPEASEVRSRVRRWRSVALPVAATRGLPLFAVEHRSPTGPLPVAEPRAPAESAVGALDHVVVATRDLEASRALYRDGLGLRLALDRSFEARRLRILFFRVGGVTVEVVGGLDAPAEPDAPDRFAGLAYRVADASAARSRLAAAGFDVSDERPGAKRGTRVFTVRRETCGVPTLFLAPDPPTTRGRC